MGIFNLILYVVVGTIDAIIYHFAATLFRVIMALKDVQFFEEWRITDIANRIYMILGVLILFEIVITAVQYIVNPDKFDEKEKGLYGLLQKTVITIVLILIVPTIFDFARSIENYVVESLPTIILGVDASENNEDIGENMAFTVLSSFVSPANGGSVGPAVSNEIHDIESFRINISQDCRTTCRYNYFLLLSTICGGFLCYILATMTLDIAVRSVKLAIIQMLSPIPISTYVFKKDNFNKFVKMSLQVYADLFIRMAIVYFIILSFRSLVEGGVIKYSGGSDWLFTGVVNLMIIFGLLMFASKAPKFLSDLLGLPEITGGDMADMFKPVWSRVGGFASPAAAIGAYRNARDYGEGRFLAARRALTAGAHATVARLRDVASGKKLDESYKSSRDAAMARTNRNLEYRNRYGGFRQRQHQIWQERFDNYTGVTSGGKKAAATIDAANKAISIRTDLWSRAEEKVLEVSGKGYNSTVTATWRDSTGSHTRNYTLSEVLTRLNDLENGARPVWAGEKEWLMQNKQESIDRAKIEFIQKALEGSGDGKARNKFAEDIFAFMRSGGDSASINNILGQTVEDVRDASGTSLGNIKLDLSWVANEIADGKGINSATAAAIAKYVRGYSDSTGVKHGIEADAGAMRVKATKTQTSVPKDSK